MKNTRSLSSLHCIAKQGGFMPTYWSAISLQNNDRTPEGITPGSVGAEKIPRV